MNRRLACLLVSAGLIIAAPAQQKTNSPAASKPASAETIYRDSAFGFRFRIPYGWVDRTKEMQDGDPSSKGQVLLAVFERPPQAAADTVNSAVVIAAEAIATYPGLKDPEDYLGPLTELVQAKGLKGVGDPSEVTIDAQRMVRADFSKAINEKRTMYQSTLIMLKKEQIVSLTFIGDGPESVERLMEGLSFSAAKSRSK